MVFKCDDLPASDSICILFSLLVTEHDAPQLPAFKLLLLVSWLLKVSVSVDACLFHDGQELSFTYLTITVLIELIDHSLELIIAQVLLHLSSNST